MYRDVFIVFVFIVVTSVCGFHQKNSHAKDFKQFKEHFHKKYRHSAHEAHAFENFKKNRDAIIAHNKRHDAGQVHYRLSLNARADWGPEDHKKINNYIPPSKEQLKRMPRHKIGGSNRFKRQTGGPILGYNPFDWRDKGVLPPVKNQGGCGTCGLFAKTTAVSAAMAIQKGVVPPVSLSVQAVDDCDYGNLTITDALDTPMFMMQYGIPTEADYPYLAGDDSQSCVDPYDRTPNSGHCRMWNGMNLLQPFVDRTNRDSWGVCAGCGDVEDDVGMIDGLKNGGPMVIGVNADCIDFSYYGSGIVYKPNCPGGVNHAIVLIGIGIQNVLSISDSFKCQNQSIPYYIIQNSWGTGFGENGYAKLAIGDNGLGVGYGGMYPALTTAYNG